MECWLPTEFESPSRHDSSYCEYEPLIVVLAPTASTSHSLGRSVKQGDKYLSRKLLIIITVINIYIILTNNIDIIIIIMNDNNMNINNSYVNINIIIILQLILIIEGVCHGRITATHLV